MKKTLELNLIKDRLVKQQRELKTLGYIRRGYLLCIAVFILLVATISVVEIQCAQCRTQIKSIKKSIQAERKEFGIEQLETEWKGHIDGMARIESNLARRTSLATMLGVLSQTMPVNASITAFSADMNSGVNVKIDLLVNEKGQTSIASVIGFLDNLKKNPIFGERVKVDSQEKYNPPGGHGSAVDSTELYKISVTR